jgi:hypothetical protein
MGDPPTTPHSELYFDTGYQARIKQIFDLLLVSGEASAHVLGPKIERAHLDDNCASHVRLYHAGAITTSEEQLAELQVWAVGMLGRMCYVLAKHLHEGLETLRSTPATAP